MNKFLRVLGKGLIFAAWVTVMVVACINLPPKFIAMRRLEERRNDYKRKIDYVKADIESLKVKQQRFSSDPDFVEYVARENKRIRSNEILFVQEE